MWLKTLETEIKDKFNKASREEYPTHNRWHLGASVIAHECARHAWYNFRWASIQEYDGRMQRLFNLGHLLEERNVYLLRKAGFDVRNIDPNTGEQFCFSDEASMNHYGGSADGIVHKDGTEFILELKTHNTKSFCHLNTHGILKSKPHHFAQMCQYGYQFNLKYGIYFAENKNDCDVWPNVIELDLTYGKTLAEKAREIVCSQAPPPKIGMNPELFTCKFCTYKSVCWGDKTPDKNCRTCVWAKPIIGGEWECGKFGQIPREFVPTGCDNWEPIV